MPLHFFLKKKNRHVIFGILPCVKTTSLRLDANLEENVSSDMLRLRRSQQEVKERWCERVSCSVEGVYTIGLCISRFLSEKVCSAPRVRGTK